MQLDCCPPAGLGGLLLGLPCATRPVDHPRARRSVRRVLVLDPHADSRSARRGLPAGAQRAGGSRCGAAPRLLRRLRSRGLHGFGCRTGARRRSDPRRAGAHRPAQGDRGRRQLPAGPTLPFPLAGDRRCRHRDRLLGALQREPQRPVRGALHDSDRVGGNVSADSGPRASLPGRSLRGGTRCRNRDPVQAVPGRLDRLRDGALDLRGRVPGRGRKATASFRWDTRRLGAGWLEPSSSFPSRRT